MKVSAAEPEVLMVLTRRSVVALAALTLLACSGHDLTTPLETLDNLAPSFARKEKVWEPVIQEFWVIPGEDTNDRDIIHVVVSNNVHTVNPSVVYDYFHNGIVDDDPPYDQHFEIYSTGPAGAVVEDLGDGWAHVDIPWDGRVHDTDESLFWPDHLSIEILDEGDPYAIFLPLLDAQGNTLDWARPRGVVVGGEETGEAEVDLSLYSGSMVTNHHAGTVRSYATFKGSEAVDHMHLSGLTMTNLQCQKTQQVSGKGKDRVVETVYRLSGLVSVAVERPSTPPDPDEWHVWWEGHFRDVVSGDLSSRVAASNAGTWDLTLSMPGNWPGSGKIEFVVDFLSGIGVTGDIVYDPWANEVSTTPGFDGTGGPVIRSGLLDGMNVPVAHSGSVSVDCG